MRTGLFHLRRACRRRRDSEVEVHLTTLQPDSLV
jgi:hypothetical protein